MSTSATFPQVYPAQGGLFNIHDLFRSVLESEHMDRGLSRVSDFHLKVGEPIRFRYDGDLEPIPGGSDLTEAVFRELVFPLISEERVQDFLNKPLEDLDTGYFWPEMETNFRLNLFQDRDGSACVLRMLPKSIPDLDEIGFLDDDVWQQLATLKRGLVLLTGVTGSGKSTTIASLIEWINRNRKSRIITLEDPVEYVFKSQLSMVSQRECGLHFRSFAQGLRSALRENPDIIFVGEIRDAESAALALAAAETGHLVLSTLHTKDVVGTFSRLLDIFPPEKSKEVATQLSFSLAYVISQRLLPRKDQAGRVAAFEVLKNDHAVANLIRTERVHQIYGKIETGGQSGMNTLEQHLLDLVESGAITKEMAAQNANDPNFLNRLSEV